MLPILSSKDISAWDQVTIANESIGYAMKTTLEE